MRVDTYFSQQIFLQNLARVGSASEEALLRLSTGRRVRVASDDPAAAARLLGLEDATKKLAMRKEGIGLARTRLDLTEAAVSELELILTRARDLGTQGATDPLGPQERVALSIEVAGLREQVVQLASQRDGGRYIFSGTATDVAPYDGAGAFQGNTSQIQIPLEDGTIAINFTADAVFGEVGVGGAIDLLDQLEAALVTNDPDAVAALLPALQQGLKDASSVRSEVGARLGRLTAAEIRLGDRELQIAEQKDAIGAADIAATITDLARLETTYQATLQSGASLFGPTFFDFVG